MALSVVLLFGGAAPVAVTAQDLPAAGSTAAHPYAGHVADAARRFGIPEAWIWAVMRVESGGNSRAVSRAGAMGLMQIMPATWAELRARYGLGADPFDVRDNIMAGAVYLRAMHDRYGNTTAMLAAYNAGPGRYDEHLSRGRPLPAETRAYLARLGAIAGDAPNTQLAGGRPSDPFAWRRAGLFVRVANAADVVPGARSGSVTVAEEPSAEPLSDSRAADPAAAVSPRPSAAADTLFVPRAGAGRPQ